MYISFEVYQGTSFIEVSFDVKQNKDIEYQIFWTTAKDQKFNGANSVKQLVSAEKKRSKNNITCQQNRDVSF